jgi:hypothetical protein
LAQGNEARRGDDDDEQQRALPRRQPDLSATEPGGHGSNSLRVDRRLGRVDFVTTALRARCALSFARIVTVMRRT